MLKKLAIVGGLVALLGCRPVQQPSQPDRFEKQSVGQLAGDAIAAAGKYVSVVGKPVSIEVVGGGSDCVLGTLIMEDDNSHLVGYLRECDDYLATKAVVSIKLATERGLKIEVRGMVNESQQYGRYIKVYNVKAAGIETVLEE